MNLTKECERIRQIKLQEASNLAIREQQARDFATEAEWVKVKEGLGIPNA